MTGGGSERLKFIWERGFDKERVEAHEAIKNFPEAFGFRCIGRKGDGRVSIGDDEANARHKMVNALGHNAQVRDLKFFARAERNIFHRPTTIIAQLREARVNSPVEDITLKQFDYLFGRVNAHGFFEDSEEIVYEDRQTGDVVNVRVCDNNVAHARSLRVRETHSDASGVNDHAIVNHKRG
jgi:hypothetical protein